MQEEKISFRQSFTLLNAYLRPEKGRVLLLTLLLFIGIGLQLLSPQILRDFIDLATGEIDETNMGGLSSCFAVSNFLVCADKVPKKKFD